MSANVEDLIPVAELARRWRCSRQHIHNLIASGALATVQVADSRAKTRIPASAVETFVRQRTNRARRTEP